MTSRRTELRQYIVDACVLIDFIKADRSVLKIVVENLGPLHVLTIVANEVGDIDSREELLELGIDVIAPKIEDIALVSTLPDSLSFQDKLCFLTARRFGFICVTNDKKIRTECLKAGVPHQWGLDLLLNLRRAGKITTKRASAIARRIRENNPKHITEDILRRFVQKLKF